MAREYHYKEWCSFDGLKQKIKESGMTYLDVACEIDVDYGSINSYICGRQAPTTEKLAGLAAVFECSVSELVEFKGFEIKEKFQKPFYKWYPPRKDKIPSVQYGPLRMLFKRYYKDQWSKKLTEFYNQIEPLYALSPEDRQKALENLKKATEVRYANLGATEHKPGHTLYTGLNSRTRHDIVRNRPIKLKYVYNMCKVLGCTPDYIMSYM